MGDDLEFQKFSAHLPTQMSKAFCDYARDVVFLTSRYLFTRREGKKQFGFCTHCHQEYETPGYKHGSTAVCESCRSVCAVKASGRSRKSLVDEAYFVYYEKSVVNPKAITARGIYAVRDYRGGYHQVETLIEVKAMYLFEPGSSVMYEKPWMWFSHETGVVRSGENWVQRRCVSSLFNSIMAHKDRFCSYDSIRESIKDTPFQYSTWDHYKRGDSDMVRFFDLYSKYPCIEYLTKLGLREVVEAKLYNQKTFGVVNWRGKDLLKVLKLTKQELKDLRAVRTIVDPWMLHLRQVAKRDGSHLSIADIARISQEITESSQSTLLTALKRTNLRRLDAYFTKQLSNSEVNQYYKTKHSLLNTWNDYISDCLRLGLNTLDEAVKFPRNLYRAHQNTIKQIKVREDKALRAKLAERSKALQKMRFEAIGFLLRPALDSKELIAEGAALHHCVGTYANDYAAGKKDIFVLRKAEEPDKPFYTMEIRQGRIVQCRGFKNCLPTDEVKAFVELFEKSKLKPKKPARVGVAV